jgi:hypothetical protein
MWALIFKQLRYAKVYRRTALDLRHPLGATRVWLSLGGTKGPEFTVVIRANYYHSIKCWEHRFPFLSDNPLLGPAGTARANNSYIDVEMDHGYNQLKFVDQRRGVECIPL